MSKKDKARAANRKAEGATPPVKRMNALSRFFDHFAAHVTKWAGSSIAFGSALLAVLVWAASGPAFGYSETWQLVINTGTTIVTFLMVFLIQQSQNKDGRALHLKLDELLIALKGADEALVDAEQLDEDKLRALAAACTARARKLAQQSRQERRGDPRQRATRHVRTGSRLRRMYPTRGPAAGNGAA